MLIYSLENSPGFVQVQHTCFMLEWGSECEKLSRISLGEETCYVDYVAVRLHLKQQGSGKLPDIFQTNSHTIVSSRFKESIESIGATELEFIPTKFVAARIEPRSGPAKDLPIEESGIEIDRDYFVLNISIYSELLDRNATTMSNEFISPDNEATPGVYITAVFAKPDVPHLFVLPSRPFGLLASEQLVTLLKKHKLRGVRAVEIMDTSKPNELNMYPTNAEHVVTMTEAWRQYESVHA